MTATADEVCTGVAPDADTCDDVEQICSTWTQDCCPGCDAEFKGMLQCLVTSAAPLSAVAKMRLTMQTTLTSGASSVPSWPWVLHGCRSCCSAVGLSRNGEAFLMWLHKQDSRHDLEAHASFDTCSVFICYTLTYFMFDYWSMGEPPPFQLAH